MMQELRFWLLTLYVCGMLMFCSNADEADAQVKLAPAEASADDVNPIEPIGMIAYVRNGSEIRVIDSAGNNDRRLWTHPDAKDPFGIFELDWKPDGKELAFSSGHENMVSLYHSDLYGIRPDGSGLRKITNRPDHSGLKQFKKGSVSITLKNMQSAFQDAQSSDGLFTVYVVGAEEPQQVLLPPGSVKTLRFDNVADLGDHGQPVVAIYGQIRWVMPGLDVRAGSNVKAPDFNIMGNGYEYFGAFRPVWNYDGSRISFRDGNCVMKSVPANNTLGVQFNPLMGASRPLNKCVWDWGPTPALGKQVLYQEDYSEENPGFYVREEGESAKAAQPLFLNSEIIYDLKWLPDGSGFVYTSKYNRESDYRPVSNVFKYDIASKRKTQLTDLSDGFARQISVSPSGDWIAFEKCFVEGEELVEPLDFKSSDIWIVGTDGQGARLLVKNGYSPAWGR